MSFYEAFCETVEGLLAIAVVLLVMAAVGGTLFAILWLVTYSAWFWLIIGPAIFLGLVLITWLENR